MAWNGLILSIRILFIKCRLSEDYKNAKGNFTSSVRTVPIQFMSILYSMEKSTA